MKIDDLAHTSRPRPLLVTEWKTPDPTSISIYITDGHLKFKSRKDYGELNFDVESIENLHGVGPINYVKSPYKQKN